MSRDLLPVLWAVRDEILLHVRNVFLIPTTAMDETYFKSSWSDAALLAIAERVEGETARLREGEQEARSTTEVAPPSVAHPSPSPALIVAFGRAIMLASGSPWHMTYTETTILALWDGVKASQTKED